MNIMCFTTTDNLRVSIFHNNVAESSDLPGYGPASPGNWIPATFFWTIRPLKIRTPRRPKTSGFNYPVKQFSDGRCIDQQERRPCVLERVG
jgi:hypothetical protein